MIRDPGGIADGDTNTLNSVRCVSLNDCWAVGNASPGVNEALHWNGTRWLAG